SVAVKTTYPARTQQLSTVDLCSRIMARHQLRQSCRQMVLLAKTCSLFAQLSGHACDKRSAIKDGRCHRNITFHDSILTPLEYHIDYVSKHKVYFLQSCAYST